MDQNTALIVAGAIGTSASIVANIISSVVLPWVTQLLNKNEKRREEALKKLEEMYFLTGKVKRWIDTQLWSFANAMSNGAMPQQVENPMNELMGLTLFYAPSLEPQVLKLNETVSPLQLMVMEVQMGSLEIPMKELGDKMIKFAKDSNKDFDALIEAIQKTAKKLS